MPADRTQLGLEHENEREQNQQGGTAPSPNPNKVQADLLIHPIGELVTAHVDNGPARRKAMHEIRRIKDGAVAVAGHQVVAAGPASQVLDAIKVDGSTLLVDASHKLVTPGLVDPHTHLLFDGNRANEFVMRCQGKSYAEIAATGGGIVASMKATRSAGKERLVELGLKRLSRMLQAGTTTCEVKTGYGLTTESELSMLAAVYDLASSQPVELVPTFMAAHAVPPESTREAYVQQIISDMLPRVQSFCRDNGVAMPFVDVFCDQGYFTLSDTQEIFEASTKLGFPLKVHADEFANLGASRLAAQFSAASADHLLNISTEEMDSLSKSNTVAVLLPGTSFYLNLKEHAPALELISRGCAVALGSDFNPGSCHIFSLSFIWGLACMHLKMSAEQALTALTCNAAYAIGKGKTVGQLRPGYQADIAIYDVQTLEEVPYNLGWNPITCTIKNGVIVHSA